MKKLYIVMYFVKSYWLFKIYKKIYTKKYTKKYTQKYTKNIYKERYTLYTYIYIRFIIIIQKYLNNIFKILGMNYSQEEIEKKRLLAIQRKQQAQLKNSSFNSTNIGNNISSNDNILIKENKSNNNTKVLGYGQSKYINFKTKFGSNSDKNNAKFNKQKERFNPISAQNFFGQKSSITGKCYMISDTRFMLEISSYFPPLIETLKTISSRTYGNIKYIFDIILLVNNLIFKIKNNIYKIWYIF